MRIHYSLIFIFSQEFEDEVPADLQDVSSIYKAARKALERGIKVLIEAAKRMHLKSGKYICYFLSFVKRHTELTMKCMP